MPLSLGWFNQNKQVLLVDAFYRWKNLGTESLHDFLLLNSIWDSKPSQSDIRVCLLNLYSILENLTILPPWFLVYPPLTSQLHSFSTRSPTDKDWSCSWLHLHSLRRKISVLPQLVLPSLEDEYFLGSKTTPNPTFSLGHQVSFPCSGRMTAQGGP